MYNIILVCQNGASTDLLALKLEEAAREQKVEMVINAYPYSSLEHHIDGADLVLLAPQVRFKLKTFQNEFADRNVPFQVVDTQDYGMLDGRSVLKKILPTLQTN